MQLIIPYLKSVIQLRIDTYIEDFCDSDLNVNYSELSELQTFTHYWH